MSVPIPVEAARPRKTTRTYYESPQFSRTQTFFSPIDAIFQIKTWTDSLYRDLSDARDRRARTLDWLRERAEFWNREPPLTIQDRINMDNAINRYEMMLMNNQTYTDRTLYAIGFNEIVLEQLGYT